MNFLLSCFITHLASVKFLLICLKPPFLWKSLSHFIFCYPFYFRNIGMAPVTRRASSESNARGGKDQKSNRIGKNRPSSLKSSQREKLKGTANARTVTFQDREQEISDHAQLPTTPYPTPDHIHFATSKEPYSQSLIYVSKRREQENLLRRAERSLGAISRKAYDMLSPPQSSSDERTSRFNESTKPSEGTRSKQRTGIIKSAKTIDVKPQRPLKIVKEDVVTSKIVNELKDDIPEDMEMPGTIEDILIEPNADIKMEEVCSAFDYLKVQIQLHCRSFYSFHMPPDTEHVPSFIYLKRNHPELFRYIRYLADGSQYGWDQLLTIGPQRENLVYAIITRAIMTHVFDAELFGASPEHQEALLKMCREYLNFDAFVRNTHRADIIAPVLLTTAEEYDKDGKDPYSYFSPAIDSLEDASILCSDHFNLETKTAIPTLLARSNLCARFSRPH